MNTKQLIITFIVLIISVMCASAFVSVPTISDGIGFQYENILIGDDRIQISNTNITKEVTFVIAASDSLHSYGADFICDGVDDQVEINTALNSFGNDNYAGTIHFMAGLYNISAPILWPNKYGITLEGEFGRRSDKCPTPAASSMYSGGTTLHLDDGADCSMIVFPATNDHLKYVQMRNIVLIGNKDGQTPGVASHGIEVVGTFSDAFFDRVIIMCFEGDGWHIEPPAGGVVKMWHVGFSNAWIEHNTNGIFIDGNNFTSSLTRLVFTNMFFMGNDYALRFEHVGSISSGPQIVGCYCEDPIYLFDTNGVLFSACNMINSDLTRPTFYVMSGANSRCMITGSNILTTDGQRFFDGTWGAWLIEGNRMTQCGSTAVGGAIVCNTGNSIIRNNQGYITEKSGTATLVSGTTSIAVAHGLDVTPIAGNIIVTPMESLGSSSFFWVDNYTSTTFNITVNVDPTLDVDFAWSAIVL